MTVSTLGGGGGLQEYGVPQLLHGPYMNEARVFGSLAQNQWCILSPLSHVIPMDKPSRHSHRWNGIRYGARSGVPGYLQVASCFWPHPSRSSCMHFSDSV